MSCLSIFKKKAPNNPQVTPWVPPQVAPNSVFIGANAIATGSHGVAIGRNAIARNPNDPYDKFFSSAQRWKDVAALVEACRKRDAEIENLKKAIVELENVILSLKGK